MIDDLFDTPFGLFESAEPAQFQLGPQSFLFKRLAQPHEAKIISAVNEITEQSAFRHLITPSGFEMSVAMTSCGPLGWVSDRRGYRYDAIDPTCHKPWPTMPPIFMQLAHDAAAKAGFEKFTPDACLINRYTPGAKLSLHQDKDERDLSQPIVSVSLGIAATFLFGGLKRSDKTVRVALTHGDVVVWGGVDRLRFHGVLPVKAERHPLLDEYRINLTFRKAR